MIVGHLGGVTAQSAGPRSDDRSRVAQNKFLLTIYVENKARLAGQPGSEPRSPASWPKVGLKPLAVADP